MGKSSSNSLKFALLGLLAQRPRSGYDVRKLFAESPMKSFSPSPGSIYPALHRLHEQGFIKEAAPVSSGGRRRQLFELSDSGRGELTVWLETGVTREDVVRALDEMQLRFAFIGEVLGDESARRFLSVFEVELSAYLAYLEAYYSRTASGMSRSGRLALECGIALYRAHAQWAKRALDELTPA